jgi:exodeoxyribonuclease VII large subunit
LDDVQKTMILSKLVETDSPSPETSSSYESKVYSVSELTRRIRFVMERVIGYTWVEGEISNLNYHPSGHVYLTLKDENAQLSAVMFRSDAQRMHFRMRDGMLVQGYGRVTVYEKRGSCQIVLESVQPAGVGNLQAAFEALKKKLQAEGLFDPARKRPLPQFPLTVGVVTSPNAAALRDFCRVLHRRHSGVRILVSPCRVQGIGAAEEIAGAIDLLNLLEPGGCGPKVDVIAIIRGGGSLEDLWAFNEEVVARAVARSRIPTICGVGHEVDFTICDFVADLRAPTPSAAAEQLIRSRSEFISQVLECSRSLDQCTRLALKNLRHRLVEIRESLRQREPRQFIREWRQRLDELGSDLHGKVLEAIGSRRRRTQQLIHDFSRLSPMLVVERKRSLLSRVTESLDRIPERVLQVRSQRLKSAAERLELLSPKGTLARGYSITIDPKSGGIVRSVKSVKEGQTLRTRLVDGEIETQVTERG